MFSFNRRTVAGFLGALVFLLSGSALVFPERAHAEAMVTVPFGGIFVFVYPACLNGMIYIMVLDYVTYTTIPLAIQPWSRLNMYYAPNYGNAALGTYNLIPGQCVISYYPYAAYTYIGEITTYPFSGMGTSLLPPVT